MKVALTIAGSDSSGGAGIQADLKAFEAFGVFGTSAITVLTAQNTTGVQDLAPMTPEFVTAQIRSVLDDFDVAAIKIGMLFDIPIIEAVRAIVSTLDIPIVFDPVFISKAGSPLLKPEAVEAMKGLFAYASLITPNRFEAKELFGFEYADAHTHARIAAAPCPVLVKHVPADGEGASSSTDVLFLGGGEKVFRTERIETNNLHGTGCSYSSAIAANLALGKSPEAAIETAKRFITEALRSAPAIGHGPGPVNHKQGGLNVA